MARLTWQSVKEEARVFAEAVGGPPMVPTVNYLLRLFHVNEPPVPVQGIARTLGVTVLQATNFGSLEGALHFPEGRPVLYVNSGHSPTKKRFTIAHELGHLLMHDEKLFRELSYTGEFSNRPEEKQANAFAANLLLPLQILEPFVGAKRQTDEEVASAFQVSVPVLRWQLEALM